VRDVRILLFAAGIAALLWAPGIALAEDATQPGASSTTPYVPASTPTSATYDLSFSLPTAGKSGCMVCHGDPNLVRIVNGQAQSMYIDAAVVESSAHAKVQCTGCHLDFAYSTPHQNALNNEWRRVAKSACKNCHKDEFSAYAKSVHSPSPTSTTEPSATPVPATSSGVAIKPLCGDCHGSHDIQKLKDNPAGQEEMHSRGKEICGNCHLDYWENYNDPYHGAAYKRGASDAPACWQCHEAHEVLPSTDRRSSVNEVNLVETCGECHHNEPNEEYTSYATLIHGREDIYRANPIYAFLQSAWETVSGWFS